MTDTTTGRPLSDLDLCRQAGQGDVPPPRGRQVIDQLVQSGTAKVTPALYEEYVRGTREDLRAWVLAEDAGQVREEVIQELCVRWLHKKDLLLPYSQWAEMFRHVGYLENRSARDSRGPSPDGWATADPPDRSEFPMRLWRSALPAHRDGMSWAARVEFALEYFVRAFNRRGIRTRLWYVDVPDSSHLLAWFGRGSHVDGEVLVDCSRLQVRPATRHAIDLHRRQVRRAGKADIWPTETADRVDEQNTWRWWLPERLTADPSPATQPTHLQGWGR